MTWAILRLAEGLTALDYRRVRLGMTSTPRRSVEGMDIVLSPALPDDPPRLGALTFAANGSDLERWKARGHGFAPFATSPDPSGQPAAVRPVRIGTRGLLLAVRRAGRPGQDLLALQFARAVEEATEWLRCLLSAGRFSRTTPHLH